VSRALVGILLAVTAVLNSACLMTSAGHQLQPITPPKPQAQNAIQQTVGDFTFNLDGGGFVTSNKAGRILNDEILNRWTKKGYIQNHEYVPSGEFTGSSRYRLTLSGSQHGESNAGLQFLSGLTLYLVPHFVDTHYKVEYKLEDADTGKIYTASVADSYKTTWQLFLLLALPVSGMGASETWDNMADHLYEQLRVQGAFDAASIAATAGVSTTDALNQPQQPVPARYDE